MRPLEPETAMTNRAHGSRDCTGVIDMREGPNVVLGSSNEPERNVRDQAKR
jgi:hypothetical protein